MLVELFAALGMLLGRGRRWCRRRMCERRSMRGACRFCMSMGSRLGKRSCSQRAEEQKGEELFHITCPMNQYGKAVSRHKNYV